VWSGTYIEKKLRVDDAVGAVAVHGVCGFYGVLLVGIFAGGYPTGVNNIPVSFGGQLMGMMAFLPLAFLPGFILSWILKKMNLLRVPAEVELEGLDLAEFQQDFFPEFERVPEVIVMPDGEEVEAADVLLDAYRSAIGTPTTKVGASGGTMFNSFPYDSWLLPDGSVNQEITDFWTWGGANSTGTYILTVLGCILMVASIIGFFMLENRKLAYQAAALRAAGAFGATTPEPPSAG
jgi:hypothetical protein